MSANIIDDLTIRKGLGFIDRLRSEDNRYKFWETLDPSIDHVIWPQSQYLAYVLYVTLGMQEEAKGVQDNNDFLAPAGDRPGVANDRFCVLIGDQENFAYERISAEARDGHADSMALLGIYSHYGERQISRFTRWIRMRRTEEGSRNLFDRLTGMYDQEKGFIGEDSQEWEMYKLSLFGIFAKIAGSKQWSDVVDRRLRETQSDNGG